MIIFNNDYMLIRLSRCGTEHQTFSWDLAHIPHLLIFGLLAVFLQKWLRRDLYLCRPCLIKQPD